MVVVGEPVAGKMLFFIIIFFYVKLLLVSLKILYIFYGVYYY